MWFGDERGYNATNDTCEVSKNGCGLVMKEDITQQARHGRLAYTCCGLVMKEDITQRWRGQYPRLEGCGLVMKEDITQPVHWDDRDTMVVVW